jgi:hypothetical protein
MNKKLIKKYKAEFDHWLNGGEVFYKNYHEDYWYTNNYGGIWVVDEVEAVVINDEYSEFRKALAEGKTVMYKDSNGYDAVHRGGFFKQYPDKYWIKPDEPKGRFIPEDGEDYFTVGEQGIIRSRCVSNTETGSVDNRRLSLGNCFRTEAHAEQARDYLAKVLPIIGFVLEHQGDLSGDFYIESDGVFWNTGMKAPRNYYPDSIKMTEETAEALLANEEMMKHLDSGRG